MTCCQLSLPSASLLDRMASISALALRAYRSICTARSAFRLSDSLFRCAPYGYANDNDNDFSTTRTMRTALAAARRLTSSRAPTHAPIATTAYFTLYAMYRYTHTPFPITSFIAFLTVRRNSAPKSKLGRFSLNNRDTHRDRQDLHPLRAWFLRYLRPTT